MRVSTGVWNKHGAVYDRGKAEADNVGTTAINQPDLCVWIRHDFFIFFQHRCYRYHSVGW